MRKGDSVPLAKTNVNNVSERRPGALPPDPCQRDASLWNPFFRLTAVRG